MASIRQQLITDAVMDRLAGLGGAVDVFRSEVTTSPTIVPENGRVKSYVVVYPHGATPSDDLDLADTSDDVVCRMQLTCVAGWSADCEFLVDQVQALIYRWAPTVESVTFGLFRPPIGYQSGPVRRDDDVSPPRFWLPLQFVIPATT